jgi:hypothetical protein
VPGGRIGDRPLAALVRARHGPVGDTDLRARNRPRALGCRHRTTDARVAGVDAARRHRRGIHLRRVADYERSRRAHVEVASQVARLRHVEVDDVAAVRAAASRDGHQSAGRHVAEGEPATLIRLHGAARATGDVAARRERDLQPRRHHLRTAGGRAIARIADRAGEHGTRVGLVATDGRAEPCRRRNGEVRPHRAATFHDDFAEHRLHHERIEHGVEEADRVPAIRHVVDAIAAR